MSLIEPGRQYQEFGWVDNGQFERWRLDALRHLEPRRAWSELRCVGFAVRMSAARLAASKQDSEDGRVTLEMASIHERELELQALGLDHEEANIQACHETMN